MHQKQIAAIFTIFRKMKMYVRPSILREYCSLSNFLCLFVATNPVWLESRTPIGNVKKKLKKNAVKELNKSPLFFFFNVAFYIS